MAASGSRSRARGRTGLSLLQEDHLLNILQRLPVSSIISFSMTCQQYHTVALQDAVWQSVCAREWGPLDATIMELVGSGGSGAWARFYKEMCGLESATWARVEQGGGAGEGAMKGRPKARASHSMSAVGGTLALYGGGSEGGRHLDDTWLAAVDHLLRTSGPSQGVQWQLGGTTEPSGRFQQSCTVIGDVMLVFGGINDLGVRSDETWALRITRSEKGSPPGMPSALATSLPPSSLPLLSSSTPSSTSAAAEPTSASGASQSSLALSSLPSAASKLPSVTAPGSSPLSNSATAGARAAAVTPAAAAVFEAEPHSAGGERQAREAEAAEAIKKVRKEPEPQEDLDKGPGGERGAPRSSYLSDESRRVSGSSCPFPPPPLVSCEWNRLAVRASPAPRGAHAAAFAGGSRVVVFGGIGNNAVRLGDTWMLDLAESPLTWQQLKTANSPSARSGHTLCWVGQNRLLLYGGRAAQGLQVLSDVWILSLEEPIPVWTPVDSGHSSHYELQHPVREVAACELCPGPRAGHSATPIFGGRVLVFGGEDVNRQRKDDVWVLDPRALPATSHEASEEGSSREGTHGGVRAGGPRGDDGQVPDFGKDLSGEVEHQVVPGGEESGQAGSAGANGRTQMNGSVGSATLDHSSSDRGNSAIGGSSSNLTTMSNGRVTAGSRSAHEQEVPGNAVVPDGHWGGGANVASGRLPDGAVPGPDAVPTRRQHENGNGVPAVLENSCYAGLGTPFGPKLSRRELRQIAMSRLVGEGLPTLANGGGANRWLRRPVETDTSSSGSGLEEGGGEGSSAGEGEGRSGERRACSRTHLGVRRLWQKVVCRGGAPSPRSYHGACGLGGGAGILVFGGMVDRESEGQTAPGLMFDDKCFVLQLAELDKAGK
eukprot:TRINITY_DN6657_c0_g2_i1.p1 TRINITY_DN6657_c0_g2~~TRINITY_DN6657_c0_g2_i1.p1  ORF type:complete len:884 (+),score=140.35 TRINITY_DN6657_c0_g2_i1:1159-3810(+)